MGVRLERTRRTETQGRRLLARAVVLEKQKEGGRSLETLAGLVGASQQSFWAWRHGTRRPGELMKRRLFDVLGVPPESWLTAAERKAFARRRVAA